MDENEQIKISFTAELSDTEKKLDSVISKLEKLQKLSKNSKINIKANVVGANGNSPVSQAISNMTGSSVSANGNAQTFQRISDIASTAGSTIKTTFTGAVSAAGSAISNLAKKPFVSFANSVKNATKGVSQLFSSLKRIAMYRALRTMIKTITDGFKEGTENAYRWAVVNNNQLATSLDSIKTESSYLKNSIGAMVAPIINALVPAIQIAVDAIVEFINSLNQLMALIGGQSTWIKANKQARSFGENLSGGAKAAKTLTAGIDELNILSESSGGGSGAELDYSTMFEEMTSFNGLMADFVSRLKDDIASGDFRDIGVAIGEKFNEIDFKDILSNGIQLGLKVVTAISESVSGYLETVNWQSFGKQIVDGIFDGFEKGNVDRAVSSIFELLGAGIGSAFGLLAGIIEGIAEQWQLYWEEIFNPYLEDDGRLTIDEILLGIVDAVVGIADWIETNIFWPFIEGFQKAFGINGESSSEMSNEGHHVIKGLWQGIKDKWNDIPEFFRTKLSALKEELTSKWDEMKQNAKDKWDAIKQNLGETWDTIKSTAQTKFKDVKDGIESKWTTLKSNTESTWSTIKTTVGTKWESIRQNADTKFQNISSTIQSVWGVVKSNTETKWTDIKSKFLDTWDKMKEGIKAPINAILSSVESFVNRIITGINSAIDAFNELFSIETANGDSVGLHFDHIPSVTIPRLYTGGFMDSGQLYSVREGGIPEYVGRYGTRAAVANNDQIVEGIAYGVADANENVVAAIGTLINVVQGLNLQVNIGDKEIGQANERYTSERGVYVNSGSFAGAY